MATRRKGLGRGLDALLGSVPAEKGESIQSGGSDAAPAEKLRNLPLELLQRGKYQPRRDMHPDALEELASSIKSQGVMQPIVVRPIGAGRYEIIAGERRWRATQQAGLDTIPAIVRDVPDEAAIAIALIENIQREDLNAIEEAQALVRLQEEFKLTQRDVADAVGKSRTMVANLMRLMNLEENVRTMVEHGDLEMGHARALLGLTGRVQISAARTTIGKGLTVRQTEALVRKLLQEQQNPTDKAENHKSLDILRLEEEISGKIGAPVSVQHTAKGSGKLVLKYNSLDELEGILAHIK